MSEQRAIPGEEIPTGADDGSHRQRADDPDDDRHRPNDPASLIRARPALLRFAGATSMHHDFWHERWRSRQIGFHQSSPHPFLERWWSAHRRVAGDARVYVPLCGKSLDMIWLAVHGHRVVGTELSPLAVQEFFGEQGAPPGVEQRGPFKRHAANAFEILEGDAFELTPELLGPVGGRL